VSKPEMQDAAGAVEFPRKRQVGMKMKGVHLQNPNRLTTLKTADSPNKSN
jgi:hypothetical protein